MGAMLALEVAVRRAEVVNRLVLCAGGPALDAQAVQDWLALRERALDAAQQPGGSMQQLAQTLVPQCIGPGALPEGVRLAEHALAQVHPATYRRALQAMQGFDRWAQAWVNVHTPTLLVGGEADHCTPPAALEALAQLMPDARHLSLPHVGHWPQLENPEAFDAALLDFWPRSGCCIERRCTQRQPPHLPCAGWVSCCWPQAAWLPRAGAGPTVAHHGGARWGVWPGGRWGLGPGAAVCPG